MRQRFMFRTFECPDGHTTHKFVEDSVEFVMCEREGCEFAAVRPEVRHGIAVHGDELDYIDHNLGPEPIRIRSKAQRRALMAATGRREFIRHTPVPGTDKSPFTTDWSKGSIDPQTLENARTLVSRAHGGIKQDTLTGADAADAEYAAIPAPANAFVHVASGEEGAAINKVFKEISDAGSASR